MAVASIREFPTIDDWVCEMNDDDDEEQAGFVVAEAPLAAAIANPGAEVTTEQPSRGGDEWEELTINSIFPDLTSIAATNGRKKKRNWNLQSRSWKAADDSIATTSLTEPLVST